MVGVTLLPLLLLAGAAGARQGSTCWPFASRPTPTTARWGTPEAPSTGAAITCARWRVCPAGVCRPGRAPGLSPSALCTSSALASKARAPGCQQPTAMAQRAADAAKERMGSEAERRIAQLILQVRAPRHLQPSLASCGYGCGCCSDCCGWWWWRWRCCCCCLWVAHAHLTCLPACLCSAPSPWRRAWATRACWRSAGDDDDDGCLD